MKNLNGDILAAFGMQLRKYRLTTGLSQEDYAAYIGVTQKSITDAELGKHSIGLENIGKFADSFGVHYYEMANPKHPIPSFDQLPKALRDYVKGLKAKKEQDKATLKKQEEESVAGLLKGTYLRTARTAQEIADKLATKVVLKDSRVAAILRTPAMRKLVKTIPGKPENGNVTRYVLNEYYEGKL